MYCTAKQVSFVKEWDFMDSEIIIDLAVIEGVV